MKTIIVDTNILFSALLSKGSKIRKIITDSKYDLCSCNYAIFELFKHKEKILKNAEVTDEELFFIFQEIMSKIQFYKEDFLSKESLSKAYQLCHNVDLKDLFFVALSIELDGYLWTGDKKLKGVLREKEFNKFFEI